MSEKFELYSIEFYIDMTKSKSLVSPIVVPSIFIIHLNGVQFLNATENELLRALVTIFMDHCNCKN